MQELIPGKNSFVEILKNKNRNINNVYINKNNHQWAEKQIHKYYFKSVNIIVKDNIFFDKKFHNVNHQHIAVEVTQKEILNIYDIIEKNEKNSDVALVAVDNITDEYNLGSIIRSAVYFGIRAIIIPNRHNALITSNVYKSSAGSVEYIDIAYVTNTRRVLNELKSYGYWIIGFDVDGDILLDNFTSSQYNKKVIVFGNEHKGIRPVIKKECDILVKIENKTNKIDSLNVSNSAAIAFYKLMM